MSAPKVTRYTDQPVEPGDYFEAQPQVAVGSWTPAPQGAGGKPTQVHMRIGTSPGPFFLVRFKGPETLDAVVDALLEHREHVWGPRRSAPAIPGKAGGA